MDISTEIAPPCPALNLGALCATLEPAPPQPGKIALCRIENNMKLSMAISSFIADVCAGKTNETPDAYRKKLRKLLCFLGDCEVEQITALDLDRFRAGLLAQVGKRNGAARSNAPLSVWYVRGVLQTCRQLFRWLHLRGTITCSPAHLVKLPKEPPKTPKPIDPATFDAILKAAAITGEEWERARNVAFLCLLRDSGGRLGGLLSARADNLRLEDCVLVTIEKGGQLHTLFFNPPAQAALRQWIVYRDQVHPRGDNLFIGVKGKSRGKALTRSAINNMLRKLAKAAGVEGERHNPHSFRHAFARDSIFGGADLSEVSQMMGHSTIKVTADYYARYLPVELKRRHSETSPGRQIELPDIHEGEGLPRAPE